MSKALRDMVEPGAYAHVFCSALSSALMCNALTLEKREKKADTGDDLGGSESPSENIKSPELRLILISRPRRDTTLYCLKLSTNDGH